MAEEFTAVVSSMMTGARRDPATGFVYVRFTSGDVYRSEAAVDAGTYTLFEKEFDGEGGRSAGKFYHRELKKLGFKNMKELEK